MYPRLWVFLGMASLGFLVGLITGMSVSPIVGSLLGLLFAFAGGSVGFLIKDRTSQEVALLGLGLFSFALATIFGVFSGIYVRNQDPLAGEPGPAPYVLTDSMTARSIITLHESKVPAEVLVSIIRAQNDRGEPVEISITDLSDLAKANVPPDVLNEMFSRPVVTEKEKKGTRLFAANEQQERIDAELERLRRQSAKDDD